MIFFKVRRFMFTKGILWPENFDDNDRLLFKAALFHKGGGQRFCGKLRSEDYISRYLTECEESEYWWDDLVKKVTRPALLLNIVLGAGHDRTKAAAIDKLAGAKELENGAQGIRKILLSEAGEYPEFLRSALKHRSFLSESELLGIAKGAGNLDITGIVVPHLSDRANLRFFISDFMTREEQERKLYLWQLLKLANIRLGAMDRLISITPEGGDGALARERRRLKVRRDQLDKEHREEDRLMAQAWKNMENMDPHEYKCGN